MKPYYKGTNSEGNDLFNIQIPPDEDDMVGRECHQEDCQPRYFKINTRKGKSEEKSVEESTSIDEIENFFCPYCGHSDNIQQFITDDQLKWMQSMMMRDMARTVHNAIESAFESIKPIKGGMFSLNLIYKPGTLPSVRHYAEKNLQRIVECDECGMGYAVYGIAIYCPWCGHGNLHIHLKRGIDTIRALITIKPEIETQIGKEAGSHLLGNCLEDCVSLFEGFMRIVYLQMLRKTKSEDIVEQKMTELKNTFQNLNRAELLICSDLGWELFEGISSSDREFIEEQFAKRHVITHNLGLVDEKYKSHIQTWQQAGQEIVIEASDLERLIKIIDRVLQKEVSMLDNPTSNIIP
jgi:hypothetical protein